LLVAMVCEVKWHLRFNPDLNAISVNSTVQQKET